MVTDISEALIISIFRVEVYPEDGGSALFLQNIANDLQDHMVLHPRKP
jgi:hypothetical protein